MGVSQESIDALLAGLNADADAALSTAAADEPAPIAAEPDPVPAPAAPEPPPAPVAPAGPRKADLRRVLQLRVPLIVTLAERHMPIESIIRINVGSIIEFEQSADSELPLTVGDCPIGAGQAVKIGENFGLRVTKIGSVEDRIAAMGHQG